MRWGVRTIDTKERLRQKRVGYMHDQTDWECPEELAEDLKELIEKSYASAGKYLKFTVLLLEMVRWEII